MIEELKLLNLNNLESLESTFVEKVKIFREDCKDFLILCEELDVHYTSIFDQIKVLEEHITQMINMSQELFIFCIEENIYTKSNINYLLYKFTQLKNQKIGGISYNEDFIGYEISFDTVNNWEKLIAHYSETEFSLKILNKLNHYLEERIRL